MIKALFPIGKTQWAKWSDAQRTAFNEAREAGVAYADAIAEANAKHAKSVIDIIEDITQVAEMAMKVTPVISVAGEVLKAVKPKSAKKDK